jgi:hypothetical protein
MPIKDAPQIQKIFNWVDGLAEGASHIIQNNMVSQGMQVQAAIVASLTTGREVPPTRLSLIKTLCHPSTVSVGSCHDKDCIDPTCKGNWAELIEEDDDIEVCHALTY